MSGLDLLRARVALRDRTLSDVLDLAIRFVVVQRTSYAKVALVGLAPLLGVALAAHWVLSGPLVWLVALPLAMVAEIPFTILASRLVFEDQVRARDVLGAALRDSPRLLLTRALTLALTAFGFMLLFVPGAWLALILFFVAESMLLERASLGQAIGRSQRLAGAALSEVLLGRLALSLIPVGAVLLFDIAGRIVLSELLQFKSPAPVWASGSSLLATIGLFAQVPYLATARFFLYLNVRTRTEGWDIQTKFNGIAARMAIVALVLFVPSAARADDADVVNQSARAAMVEERYAFCTSPDRPLKLHQRELCSLASRIDGCEGFAAACAAGQAPKSGWEEWLERLVLWAAPLASVLLYLLVAGIVVLVAIPVLHALARRRRERRITTERAVAPNTAALLPKPAAEGSFDAEDALRRADELRERGELEEALGLYLAAALAALDRQGTIRLARHRTNGEYVRGCADETSRSRLREIVREVDKVEFGGALPNLDAVVHVARRAQELVRSSVPLLAVAILVCGATLSCAPPRRGANPAGDELPREVLRRNGFSVGSLPSSLATMPMPAGGAGDPVVIVDVERVPLEADAQAHLVRWVEAGGVLVLLGRPSPSWPSPLTHKSEVAATHELVVRPSLPNSEIAGAVVARPDAFTWKDGETVATLGRATYAATRSLGQGTILSIANDNLFTNVGVLPHRNATALVELVRTVASRRAGGDGRTAIHVARAEDGVPPPSNPFAALLAAGLAKGAWHALAATLLLFLAYGIRHARPKGRDRETRRAFAEHVEATGAFYARARAHTHALAAYGRFVESKLRELMPRGTEPTAFLASRSTLPPERVADLYARALNAKAEDRARGDELEIIEELRRMLRGPNRPT